VLDLMARLRADEPMGLGQRLGELLNDVRQGRRPAHGQAAPEVEYAVHGAGSQREQTALREARDQHRPATNAIVTYFLGRGTTQARTSPAVA
jgi:hypothetical protein